MSHETILRDLNNQFADKMLKASQDFLDRCNDVGIPKDDFYANFGAKMIGTVAKYLALTTSMPAQQAGDILANLVTQIRAELPEGMRKLIEESSQKTASQADVASGKAAA